MEIRRRPPSVAGRLDRDHREEKAGGHDEHAARDLATLALGERRANSSTGWNTNPWTSETCVRTTAATMLAAVCEDRMVVLGVKVEVRGQRLRAVSAALYVGPQTGGLCGPAVARIRGYITYGGFARTGSSVFKY